ncbi:hypothetical protein H6P81_010255 [Aristolochia fimbriata]|uniref:Uncharacterized protein n=1 Tax=Aristolochia fimbriata TaxID=158543 RepID=A0AAV7ENA6_ARIFI|nr:hypothetical protein H6P81_010255 [Aristolochia fimbriata]
MGDSRLFRQKLVDPGAHPPVLKWGNHKFQRKEVYMNEIVSGQVHEVGQSSSQSNTEDISDMRQEIGVLRRALGQVCDHLQLDIDLTAETAARNEMNEEQSETEYEEEPNEEYHRSDSQPDEEQPDPEPEVAVTQRRQVRHSRTISDPFVCLKTYQRRNKNT